MAQLFFPLHNVQSWEASLEVKLLTSSKSHFAILVYSSLGLLLQKGFKKSEGSYLWYKNCRRRRFILTDFDSWFEAEQSWWWQIENSLIKKMHHFEIDAIAILLPIFLPIGEQLCVLRRGGGGFDSSSSSISSQASKLTRLRKHSEMEGILVANLKENQP